MLTDLTFPAVLFFEKYVISAVSLNDANGLYGRSRQSPAMLTSGVLIANDSYPLVISISFEKKISGIVISDAGSLMVTRIYASDQLTFQVCIDN